MRKSAVLLVLGVVACDSDFSPPAELKSVRIMAVQKHAVGGASDLPWSTAEGAALEMTMLAFDGRDDRDVPVVALWFSGCSNPPGDAYYGCFSSLAVMGLLLERCQEALGPLPWELAPDSDPAQALIIAECAPELAALVGNGEEASTPFGLGARGFASMRIGRGASFLFDVPDGVVLEREAASDYGVSYVFFSACAGRIGLVPEYRSAFETGELPEEGLVFPLGCYDDADRLRGVEHFVSGYTTAYSYGEDSSNENTNPPIDGAVIRGEEIRPTAGCDEASCFPEPKVCVGLDCVSAVPCDGDGECHLENPVLTLDNRQDPRCDDFAACVPTCAKGDPEDCPSYAFKPILARTDVLSGPGAPDEQMWIRYYASQGTISRDPVRLYDSTAGWNDDYETHFSAPKKPGPFYLWAAVHDSRGGVNFVRASLLAQ